jgi:hypothetical protein
MRGFAIFALAVGTAFVGCAHTPPAATPGAVVEYHPGVTAISTHVGQAGVYTLIALDQPQLANPVISTQAWPGTRIGFLRLRDHSVVAVIGRARFPIPEGTYVWMAPGELSGVARSPAPPVPPGPPPITTPPGQMPTALPPPPATPSVPAATLPQASIAPQPGIAPQLPSVPSPKP